MQPLLFDERGRRFRVVLRAVRERTAAETSVVVAELFVLVVVGEANVLHLQIVDVLPTIHIGRGGTPPASY